MKTNEYGDVIFSEDDIIDLLYKNPNLDISKLYMKNAEKYCQSLDELGIALPPPRTLIEKTNLREFDKINCENWHMPKKYLQLDVLQWLLDKCQNDEEKNRVRLEYDLFEKKNFIRILQFLIYFVDTLRANNVVWGVGRGSSVSSFCLFLIGIHKINSLEYDLDHREFLR